MSTPPRVRKGLVEVGAAFVAHAQPAKTVAPGRAKVRSDHPAVAAETLRGHPVRAGRGAGRWRVHAERRGSERSHSPCSACSSSGRRRGRPPGPARRAAPHQGLAPAAWSRTRWRLQSTAAKGNPPRSTARVALRARAAAVDRSRAGLLAPFGAGTEHGSTAARLQSRRTASARRWTKTMPTSTARSGRHGPRRHADAAARAATEARLLFHNAPLTSGLARRQTYQKARFGRCS